jgi:hypothetical protein
MSVKHDMVKKNRAKCSLRGKTCRSSLVVLTALTTMGKNPNILKAVYSTTGTLYLWECDQESRLG